MSKVIVNEHRLSLAPEMIPGSMVQPYDASVDRPETVTEGAHLVQYYSNAWLAACKAGELLKQQAESEIKSIEQQAEIERKSIEKKQQLEIAEYQQQLEKTLSQCKRLTTRTQEMEKELQKRQTPIAITMLSLGGLVGFVAGFIIRSSML